MSVVERRVAVTLPPDSAFAAFCDLGMWWPREYTWTGDAGADLVLETWEGGHATEVGPEGFRLDWATVRAFVPGERLALAWQIGPDRVPIPTAHGATIADIRFAAARGGCEVSVRHDFEGDDAWASAMDGGWQHLLARFADHAGAAPDAAPARARRIVANLPVADVARASDELAGLLGLDVAMDLGWIRSLRGPGGEVQVVEQGEHGPALSVGVADVDAAHARAVALGLDVVYPLTDEPWGVRRFFFELGGGPSTVNVVAHR